MDVRMTARDYIEIGAALAIVWHLRKDVNGIGSKNRKLVAENIIQNQTMEKSEFAALVRRLLG